MPTCMSELLFSFYSLEINTEYASNEPNKSQLLVLHVHNVKCDNLCLQSCVNVQVCLCLFQFVLLFGQHYHDMGLGVWVEFSGGKRSL